MASSASEAQHQRIETDEEFRRKKRNCLATGTLALGFALANTGNEIGVPGFSDAKISSWVLGVGLLVYLIYTTFEYVHEYNHQWTLNSALAKRYRSEKTALSAIKSLIDAIEIMDQSFRSSLWKNFSEEGKIYSDINESSSRIRDLIFEARSNIIHAIGPESGPIDLRKIAESLDTHCTEIDSYSKALSDFVSQDFILRDEGFRERYQLVRQVLDELKRLIADGALPSTEALTRLSNSFHRSDRLMFGWHDGSAPFALAGVAGMALIIDISVNLVSILAH